MSGVPRPDIRMFSPEHREAFQEIANVGVGMAGDAIARLLGEFVKLSVPHVNVLPVKLLGPAFARIVGDVRVAAARQAFHGDIRGELMILLDCEGRHDMAGLMGYDTSDCAAEQELLLDVCNMLAGACLRGIAQQLQADIAFSPPQLVADRSTAARLFQVDGRSGESALFVAVNFGLEQRSFTCHLIILIPDEEVAGVAGAIDRLLAVL
jgi:chemotaxis protein CheC